MKLEFDQRCVRHAAGQIEVTYPVLDARQIGSFIVVLYDYMAFSREGPARNLFAYASNGQFVWRAEDIGQGQTDGFTNVVSEEPLVVGNFAGFTCSIDLETGHVLTKVFTK